MLFLWAILLVPFFYISTCGYISSRKSNAFDLVNIGDSEEKIARELGAPSVRERWDGTPFRRYTAYQCQMPCMERLWFENRLGLDMEAWSVELDTNRRIIKKSRWVSP